MKSTSRGLPFVEVRGCSVGVERSARQSPAVPHCNDLMSHCYVRAQSRQQFHVMKSLIETAKIRMENIACWWCNAGVERLARPPRPTPMTSCRMAMFAHRVANNFTSWNRWLKLQRFGWKISHVDVNKAALHALKLAHDGVRRHLCRKTNPHSCRKTKPTGAKMKNCSTESTCRSFSSWCMVYILSSDEGDQETNDEARNESVVLKVWTSHLGRAGFFFEEAGTPHQWFSKNVRQQRAT